MKLVELWKVPQEEQHLKGRTVSLAWLIQLETWLLKCRIQRTDFGGCICSISLSLNTVMLASLRKFTPWRLKYVSRNLAKSEPIPASRENII